jgi:hypothetical protein
MTIWPGQMIARAEMNVRFHGHGRLTGEADEVVQRELERLNRRLSMINDDLRMLDVTVHRLHRDGSHEARILLQVPNQQIVTTGTGTTRPAALRDAFGDLDRALETWLAHLRGEAAVRRATRARELIGAETDDAR